jgi:ribonucleoside-diphosphate reductase alpha chain
VIDTCAWPLPEINDVVTARVRSVLGIMGFADLCLNLNVTYGSPASIDLMDEMMGFVRRESWNASIGLAPRRERFLSLNRTAKLTKIFFTTRSAFARCSADAAQL